MTVSEPEIEAVASLELLSLTMSMMLAPLTPTVPDEVVAYASVKVTVPKSTRGTRDSVLPSTSVKSSTIHSAFSVREGLA